MTTQAILVLNVGSSSVKASVFEAAEDLRPLSHGGITGIGTHPEFVWNGTEVRHLPESLSHAAALRESVEWIIESGGDWRFGGVGHRIVHGGQKYTAPVLLTPQVRKELGTLVPLAPLHQANNLRGVGVVAELCPELPQIGCFDTAFHAKHDPLFQLYALPLHVRNSGIRRYGFHGLSYELVARVLGLEHPGIAAGRVVVAHLGSGASLCAMRAGSSIDTTMGMTTLDGLPMGTRCGSIDPGAVLFMLRQLNLDADRIEQILFRESGLLGLSGISGDVRDLLASKSQDAEFALRFYALMTAQAVARMVVSLGGIDALAFTGGVGEHAASVREMILGHLSWMTPFEVLVIAANEDYMIAEHCREVLNGRAEA
jgi:acetate kinase